MKNFDDIFDAAKPGDILVSKGKGLISSTIAWILKFDYSHVLIKLTNDSIIESNAFGVSHVKFNEFKANTKKLKNLGFPGDDSLRMLFIKNMQKYLNAKYDWWLLFGDLISRIIHRPRSKEGLLNDKHKYVCSEVVSAALRDAGFILPYLPSQMTPEDLYYYVKEKTEGAGDEAQAT